MDNQFFKYPMIDPDYSVSPFWFWNDEINDRQTVEQMKMMNRIGANQPIIHARMGLLLGNASQKSVSSYHLGPFRPGFEVGYLSQEWFDRIKAAIEFAKDHDMKLWLYDEYNWPSGNCAWTLTKDENIREHFLQFEYYEFKDSDNIIIDIKSKKYLCISAFSENQFIKNFDISYQDKILIQSDGIITKVVAVYVDVDAYEPIGKFNIDYLSKEAIRKFIDSTHEKYYKQFGEEFGKIISGIFMDETRFCNAMPWTEKLPEIFEKRKGYDIIPELAKLVVDTNDSKYVRLDYYDVVTDMYVEATFKQINDWCLEHGLKTIGHLLGEETISAQSYFGGDMTRGYQYFQIPAIDHLGNGIGSLDAKFAVSACHNYGKMKIACEAFGASGWDITYEDMVKISNWLFQQGINQILIHGFYYSTKDERWNDFPPSYFYQWKYWDKMKEYVPMANRMMKILSDGKSENEILIYCPMETYWQHVQPDLSVKTGFWQNGPKIRNEIAAKIDKNFQLICNKLSDLNLDYTIFNADVTKNFYVEGKELVNCLSNERFSIFILPNTEILFEDTYRLLSKFVDNGGILLTYQTGAVDIVYKSGKHHDLNYRETINFKNCINCGTLDELISYCKEYDKLPFKVLDGISWMSHNLYSYPDHLIDPYIHDGESVFGVGITRYIKDNKRIFNITNYNNQYEKLTISFDTYGEIELWIPETGEIRKLPYTKDNCGETIQLELPANRCYFVVTNI
ncbi:glycosyl hydrolase [Thermoanaerobacterium saccharolyticum]|uniref:glycosyl hydrolase n=1 Tax=Thermoanaerobacterium saccharolyticum TaxID=28896 RepID=UPI002FDB4CB5